jgi:hypothetical protein
VNNRVHSHRMSPPMCAWILVSLAGAVFTSAVISTPLVAAPLSVPFDFSRGAIGLDATISGQRVYVMLDTGVDPSVIDTNRAEALGLKVDRGVSGEVSGFGDARSASVFPATIGGLAIGSRDFGPVDALASDLSAMSAAYGRKLDAVLGYSFLKDKIVLIDYPNRKVVLLDRLADARPTIRSCGQHWSLALQTLSDDNWPIIPNFRFGSSVGPVTLDTGSNGGIGLFERALDLPGMRPALVESGDVEHAGFRGNEKSKTYVLNESVGFGPFRLPAGQVVTLTKASSATDKRVANIGNQLFAVMNLKIMLNYAAKQLQFYGNCGR